MAGKKKPTLADRVKDLRDGRVQGRGTADARGAGQARPPPQVAARLTRAAGVTTPPP
jgi:hypothetical protein